MAEGYRRKSQNDDPSALPVKPERDGKQPAHGRVQAMERAEPYKSQPGPENDEIVSISSHSPGA
jgi:hypothetical protein